MHDFHGLWQYPYCSIIPLILIFLCKLHLSCFNNFYTCHILFLTLNLTTDFLSPSWISVRFGQRGDKSHWGAPSHSTKELTPLKTSIPSTSFAIILFLWSLFIVFFYSHDKNHGLLLIQFLVPLIFLIFCLLSISWLISAVTFIKFLFFSIWIRLLFLY